MKMVSIACRLNEPAQRRLDRTASTSCIQLEEAATPILESANMMPPPLSATKPSVLSSVLLQEKLSQVKQISVVFVFCKVYFVKFVYIIRAMSFWQSQHGQYKHVALLSCKGGKV